MYGIFSRLVRSGTGRGIVDMVVISWNTALRLINSTFPFRTWSLTGHNPCHSLHGLQQTRDGCSCEKEGWMIWLWHSLRFDAASRLIPRWLSSRREHPVQAVAQPITPPQRAEVPDHFQIIVDYNRKPFSITWRRRLQYPNLSEFPTITDADVNPISQTASMRELWTQSVAFSYGSCASIRIQDDLCFPILKLAHSDIRFIRMVQHEFALLTSMALLDLPVIQVGQQPILDNGEICGFRMKRVFGLCRSSLISRRSDIQDALRRLHSAGFCHGDIRGNNIMEDEAKRIIFIDFGLGGRIGSDAPDFFPRRIDSRHFTAEHDWDLFYKEFD